MKSLDHGWCSDGIVPSKILYGDQSYDKENQPCHIGRIGTRNSYSENVVVISPD